MKTQIVQILISAVLALAITSGCGPGPSPTPEAATQISTTIPTESQPTAVPQGKTITVTSSDDSGPGSLRRALEDAQPYDEIVFDPAVFPPDAPETIAVTSPLPQITQGYLTIDASNAGVILDGSNLPADSWIPGLEIVSSNGNIIRGLQVIHFTGTGIVVAGHSQDNVIGGDRNVGTGPIGQGNLASANDFGIGVWDYSSNNVLTGNLVGTDAAGTQVLGNRTSGVWITENGTKNMVGPDNIIAHNGKCGVQVDGADSLGNTLSRNSLFDNGGIGICLFNGANAKLGAPLIFDFKQADGLISGTACANCSVEIFSDAGGEGATYEGQAVADGRGAFTFEKGSAFTSANVTSTTTDADGNTSGFSRPVGLAAGVPTLQAGNSLPGFLLLTRPSSELDDNRIGMSYAGAGLSSDIPNLDSLRDEINDFGAKRIHSSLYEIEAPIDWSLAEYEIPAEFDQFIDDLNKDGVAFDYILHFWDKEGHPNGEGLATPRFKTEDQVQDFVDYVRFIVGHFKGRIQYYTIWSEPDNCGAPAIKCVTPEDYIDLARQVIPVIRQEDPQAKVGNAPNVLFFARDYLRTIVASDVISMFDVVQWHGLYDVAPNIGFYGNYYYEYPALIEEIRQTAYTNGFDGEYWATEITWCSEEFPTCHAPDQPWGQQKTDLLSAKYYARGVVMHLGLDMALSIGGFQAAAPWSYSTVRNLNTLLAGATPASLPADIASEAKDIVSYGFTLPNGDRLFALWTNGTAIEYDPGVSATLKFPNLSVTRASGIDVLNGFEQELITEMENGNLVIRDLLVKDYPIILRLTP